MDSKNQTSRAAKTGKEILLTSQIVSANEKLTLSFPEEFQLSGKDLQWSTSENKKVSVKEDGTILALAPGEATITAKDKSTGDVYRWKVTVIQGQGGVSQGITESLPARLIETKLVQLLDARITSSEDLIQMIQKQGLEEVAEKLDMDKDELRVQAEIADLLTVPGIKPDVADILHTAGFHNSAQLGRADPDKIDQFFENYEDLIKHKYPDWKRPGKDDIKDIVEGVDHRHFYPDPELPHGPIPNDPGHGITLPGITPPDVTPPSGFGKDQEAEQTENIDDIPRPKLELSVGNNLKSLVNLETKPPLPRIVSGAIQMRKASVEQTDHPVVVSLTGYVVQMSGISSPGQDKVENNKDLSCFSGADGEFSLVMPNRYNMQEIVTFTISENPNSAEVLARQRYLGNAGPRSVTFTRRATDIINAATYRLTVREEYRDENGNKRYRDVTKTVPVCEIFDKFNRLQLLNKENAALEPIIRQKAEAEIRRAALKSKRVAEDEKRSSALREILERLEERRSACQKTLAGLEEHVISLPGQFDREPVELAGQLHREPTELAGQLDTGAKPDFQRPTVKSAGIGRPLSPEVQEQLEQHAAGARETNDGEQGAMLLDRPGHAELSDAILLQDPATEPAGDADTETVMTKIAECRQLIERFTDAIERCEERLSRVGTEPVNFRIGENEYKPVPGWEELQKGSDALDEWVSQEDRFMMAGCLDGDTFAHINRLTLIRGVAREAKKQIALLSAELNSLPAEELQDGCDVFEQYLSKNATDYIPEDNERISEAQAYVNNRNEYNNILAELGCSKKTVNTLLNRILSAELVADLGVFKIQEEAFGPATDKPSALPNVKLMGEGSTATYLPTDTAPSRLFNYKMIQRLVEPDITNMGSSWNKREKLQNALDVFDFKNKMISDPTSNIPIACSLGMGYVLNMHQAWVPDGFALGSLLYSLVLAPGEEQRIIIKEHSEEYTVDDQASAMDTIQDTYRNSQQDNEEAAFMNAANRFSAAHSDYKYESKATSKSTAGLGLFFGLVGGTKSSASNSGSGSSNASQSDTYNEVSQAAQNFQSDIKTESERIAMAQRASIRVASSSESESVASKIIANHNHSHVMTIQYWEVMRRYRMETCIEGIDLVLFVPMMPVPFLPTEPENTGDFGKSDSDWKQLKLPPEQTKDIHNHFHYRYGNILKHADTLLYELPYGYRSGLETMKRFAACPKWEFVSSYSGKKKVLHLNVTGNILECDELEATLVFSTGRRPLRGAVVRSEPIRVHESMNSRKDVLYFLDKARKGKYVIKLSTNLYKVERYITFFGKYEEIVKTHATTDHYLELDLTDGKLDDGVAEALGLHVHGAMQFQFTLPAGVSENDISSIRITNKARQFSYRLCQDTRYMEEYEEASVKNYEEWLYHFSEDDKNNVDDSKKIRHYAQNLPECYTNPQVVISGNELSAIGNLEIQVQAVRGYPSAENLIALGFAEEEKSDKTGAGDKSQGTQNRKPPASSDSDSILVDEQVSLGRSPAYVIIEDRIPVMHSEDVEQMEQTLRHIVTNTIHYSQVIWSSLTDDERILMLEPYTLDLDFTLESDLLLAPEEERAQNTDPIPLLNCVNPKRVLGFYGNCMLLPFNYPERLAKALGKTAGEIQDELYRYHTTNFRVPSTVVSVATEGMVGEAVLGATNVSEKVDITRFWNWKDSDIDHMSIDQSSFNGGSSLLANAETMHVDAPTQGVTPTAHIDANGLAAALLARQSPTFADALANTDIRDLLKTSDTNASAGREAAVQASSGMVNTAVQAAADVAKAYFGGGGGSGGKGSGKDSGVSSLVSGLSSGDLGKLLQKLPADDIKKLVGLGDSGKDDDSGNPESSGKPEGGGKPEGSGKPDGDGDGGGGGKPTNPNPPAADDNAPSPDPTASNPDPNKQDQNPDNSGDGGNDAKDDQTRQALSSFFDAAVQSMGKMDSVEFFANSTGLAPDAAKETIKRFSDEFCAKNRIDLNELIAQIVEETQEV